jgi:hypothetical protein
MNNESPPSDARRKLTRFEREEGLVRLLLDRLGQVDAKTSDPKAGGTETGVDVAAHLSDVRTIGIQVTEIDPFAEPGAARAQEKAIAVRVSGQLYGLFAQNDPVVVLNAVSRAVESKVKIAENHLFDGYDEVWLLVCAGVPECGAVASTVIPTRQISASDLNEKTNHLLKNSKYNQCFLFSILGSEQALYSWNNNSRWNKAVLLEDISESQGATFRDRLIEAARSLDHQEIDRLTDEEAKKTLSELRGSDTNQS